MVLLHENNQAAPWDGKEATELAVLPWPHQPGKGWLNSGAAMPYYEFVWKDEMSMPAAWGINR
jgi:hypothetical protein